MSHDNHPPKSPSARLLWDLDMGQFDALIAGDRELLTPVDADSDERTKPGRSCSTCGGALLSTDKPGTSECVRCGRTELKTYQEDDA